jgi:photosystem II stability/assembly factor-like uncharacterized protein
MVFVCNCSRKILIMITFKSKFIWIILAFVSLSIVSCEETTIDTPDPEPETTLVFSPVDVQTSSWLKAVQFIDESTGWIVGWNETILSTTDGGSKWDVVESKSLSQYNDLHFNDSQNGIIVGKSVSPNGALVKKTTNGGLSWIDNIIEEGSGINACEVKGNMAIVVGENGLLYRSIDGGNSWVKIDLGTEANLTDVCAIDENNLWLCGSNGVIMQSTDGGLHWLASDVDETVWFQSIDFTDESRGLAVTSGGQAKIYYTENKGSSWNVIHTTALDYVNTVNFVDENTAFVAGNNSKGYYSDRIITSWNEIDFTDATEVNDIYFVNNTNGWAVGINGYVSKFEEITVTP